MRRFSAEWDFPDGVVDGEAAANAVVADLRREAAFRVFLQAFRRTYNPRKASPTNSRVAVLTPDEARDRDLVLEGARRGEAAAVAALRDRYRGWLILPGSMGVSPQRHGDRPPTARPT